ncbi:MAG: sigma-54-dependent Fis family transcriptional regulator [Acidobacteria bacterium]|nr:sigma-54-dependent Fis family transcriptional regulator [Acidobacteriota bacterium]
MPLFRTEERRAIESLARLADCNPFSPAFVEGEREILGPDHAPAGAVWSLRTEPGTVSSGLESVGVVAERAARDARERLLRRPSATTDELRLYASLVIFTLYQRYAEPLHELHLDPERAKRRVACYRAFRRDLDHFLLADRLSLPQRVDPAHLFACFYQVRRAFHLIHRHIVGASAPAARLRAAVWQSIFTHDMRRYWRWLYDRMHDVTTLITGPSGTGKELVARAIGLSRYIPFDPERETFTATLDGAFHALNVSALSPTIIESELFGHRRGAFTGAVQDRVGWLEACPPFGAVLLDEVGEIDAAIQVKLLRVLQTREFARIGETAPRAFQGRLIAATNRDLAAEMQAGRFREDLYYRLCADLIVTPSLREQLHDAPDELRNLVVFVSERVVGPDGAAELADEVLVCVARDLGPDYAWPGNVRELEQCVRNVLVRKEYRPPAAPSRGPADDLAAQLGDGRLTAEEVLRRYCTIVYARTGSYQETARRLELDRRTIKRHIDPELLARLTDPSKTSA